MSSLRDAVRSQKTRLQLKSGYEMTSKRRSMLRKRSKRHFRSDDFINCAKHDLWNHWNESSCRSGSQDKDNSDSGRLL